MVFERRMSEFMAVSEGNLTCDLQLRTCCHLHPADVRQSACNGSWEIAYGKYPVMYRILSFIYCQSWNQKTHLSIWNNSKNFMINETIWILSKILKEKKTPEYVYNHSEWVDILKRSLVFLRLSPEKIWTPLYMVY